jgi:hypothetical protein
LVGKLEGKRTLGRPRRKGEDNTDMYLQVISPVTGLEWPRGFQEVKVPRFHDKGMGRW